MADATYDAWQDDILGGTAPNVTSDTVDCRILANGYTFAATHAIASLTAYGSEADQPLAAGNSSITAGVWDNSDDEVFPTVDLSVGTLDAIAVFFNTTVDVPMAYFDSFTGVTPNGGDITVQWNVAGILAF